ncbi:MAG: twin-arginine translocase subunit TatC [Thermomicrobiales bacterium]
MARVLRQPKLPTKLKIPRLPKVDEPYEDVFKEMTLAEHLTELRDRLIRTCFAIGGAFVIGLILSRRMLGIIQDHANAPEGIDILSPTDPFVLWMKVGFYIAIAIAAPVILYQMIAFLSPGLTRKEKRLVYSSLPIVSLLFIAGASFAFFLAVPRALNFLSSFLAGIVDWSPNGPELLNFYLTLMVGLGIAFQLPIVMFLLAKLNIVTPQRMAGFRRYAFVLILVAAAIITPTPDPFNMAFVAAPIYVLYELGLIFSRIRLRGSHRTNAGG